MTNPKEFIKTYKFHTRVNRRWVLYGEVSLQRFIFAKMFLLEVDIQNIILGKITCRKLLLGEDAYAQGKYFHEFYFMQ